MTFFGFSGLRKLEERCAVDGSVSSVQASNVSCFGVFESNVVEVARVGANGRLESRKMRVEEENLRQHLRQTLRCLGEIFGPGGGTGSILAGENRPTTTPSSL
jgi:hypothetical protein